MLLSGPWNPIRCVNHGKKEQRHRDGERERWPENAPPATATAAPCNFSAPSWHISPAAEPASLVLVLHNFQQKQPTNAKTMGTCPLCQMRSKQYFFRIERLQVSKGRFLSDRQVGISLGRCVLPPRATLSLPRSLIPPLEGL